MDASTHTPRLWQPTPGGYGILAWPARGLVWSYGMELEHWRMRGSWLSFSFLSGPPPRTGREGELNVQNPDFAALPTGLFPMIYSFGSPSRQTLTTSTDMIHGTSATILHRLREITAWALRLLGAILLALYLRLHQQQQTQRKQSAAKSGAARAMGSSSRKQPQDGKADGKRAEGTRTAGKATASTSPPPPLSQYCTACTTAASSLRTARNGADERPSTDALPFITCGGGCGSEHRAHLFSAEQRQRPDDERICIGREGRIQLCEHVSFGWDDVRRRSRKARGGPMVARCDHSSHELPLPGLPAQCARFMSPKAEFWRNKTGSIVVRLSMESHICLADEAAAEMRFEEARWLTSATWWPRSALWDSKSLFTGARRGEVRARETYWFGHGDNTQFLMRVRRCKEEGGAPACATFTVERTVVIHRGPWDAQWRSALDPWTYRQSEDADMEGVSWCSDASCRSHEDEINGGRWGLRPEDFDRPMSRIASAGGVKSNQRVRMRCPKP